METIMGIISYRGYIGIVENDVETVILKGLGLAVENA